MWCLSRALGSRVLWPPESHQPASQPARDPQATQQIQMPEESQRPRRAFQEVGVEGSEQETVMTGCLTLVLESFPSLDGGLALAGSEQVGAGKSSLE